MAGAKAAVEAIKELSKGNLKISSLQKYFFKTKSNKYVLTIYENKITERIKANNVNIKAKLNKIIKNV